MVRARYLVVTCLSLLSAPTFAASALTLGHVKSRLVATDGSWYAAPRVTNKPITANALPESTPDIPEQLSVAAHNEEMSEVALPTSFDWRDQAGVSYLGGVAAQGECGSCVSFAAVSTLEAQLNIACGTPDRAFALSRQYFFSCGGGNCSSGWKISDAVAYLEDHGVPDEACLPYAAGEGTDVACDSACDDATNRRVRGVDIERPTVGYVDVPAIKQALLRGPLLANMILFEDLEFYAGGVYRQTTGRQLGSHAIVLVGWNDAEQAWIARNSWGEGWGEQGYFRIAWDDRTLPGRYTWAFDVDAAKAAGVCSQPR